MKNNTGPGFSGTIGYALEDEADGRRAMKALQSAFDSRRERRPQCELIYFDTFDWRLYRQGFRLSMRRRNGARVLTLESPRYSLETPLGKSPAPSFGPRLPEGPLKARLSPILEVRRLLPSNLQV